MQIAETHFFTDWIFVGKGELGEIGSEQADFAAGNHVVLIEVSSLGDEQAANLLEAGGDADEIDWSRQCRQ